MFIYSILRLMRELHNCNLDEIYVSFLTAKSISPLAFDYASSSSRATRLTSSKLTPLAFSKRSKRLLN